MKELSLSVNRMSPIGVPVQSGEGLEHKNTEKLLRTQSTNFHTWSLWDLIMTHPETVGEVQDNPIISLLTLSNSCNE